ncbi:MAG: hypothetical protein K8V42_06300 [Enterococcus aquimarinus]|uniref:Uncharacterized protein n=1 Tax=Enterococcus aquimarinus TaxID=328396 RepID=A0A9E4DSJ4_9ENTE|nr:hypothetical protein [Enterococcus aquimarinus]
MKTIIITDDDNGEIKFERKGVNEANATFMLAATLIAASRSVGLTEEKLNSSMSGLWEEGSVTEVEE